MSGFSTEVWSWLFHNPWRLDFTFFRFILDDLYQPANNSSVFICLFVCLFFFLLFSWEDWEMKFSIYHSERFIACLNTTLPWNDVKVRGQPRGWRSHGWSFDSHWPLSRRTALKGFYYGIFPVILPISCLLWLVISPYTLFYR